VAVYGDKMERLELTVTSPDGEITALVTGGALVDFAFAQDAYRRYTPDMLSRQLAALCQLGWTGHRRASIEAWAEAVGDEYADEERRPSSRAQQELFDARKDLEISGLSARGFIAVSNRGWLDWQVQLAPETLSTLSEQEFVAEGRSAMTALLADYKVQYGLLLEDYNRTTHPEMFERPG
jgi:hypothetical protein